MSLDVEQLYMRYGGMVHRRCRSLLRDDELAADAMHDVFVQLLRYESQLTAQAPSALLYRIATHVSLNRLRTTRRKPEHRDEVLLLQLADDDRLEERSAARAFLDRIFGEEPVSTRTMAVLHLVDGMTLEEVADTCHMSVSGVRKRLQKLKERLAAQEGALV